MRLAARRFLAADLLEDRNSLEGPSDKSVDVRDLNTVWGSFDPNVPPIASYNTARDVFNPRQAQVGLRVRF